MPHNRISPFLFAVLFTALNSPNAWSYAIRFDQNSHVQFGPIIFPGVPNPNASSAAMIAGRSLVKVKSKTNLNAHSRRGASTEVFIFGYEIEFVIQPGPGEPNQVVPVEFTVSATGKIDTLADATARNRGTSYAKAGAAFSGEGELPGLLLELDSDQRASARAPGRHDPPEAVANLTKVGIAFLMADGGTKHVLGCGATTEAWSRLKDWQGILQAPAATAVADFHGPGLGLTCTLGMAVEPILQQQYPRIKP